MQVNSFGNLLINGDFLPSLWTRLSAPEQGIECPVWRETFAADRWKIRYGQPEGAAVTQALLRDVPPDSGAVCGLEIRGAAGVTQPVVLGQCIESAESARYRRQLLFSAWIQVIAPAEVQLALGTPQHPDDFGGAANSGMKIEFSETISLPANRWTRIERAIDARNFANTGLSVELAFPTTLLATAEARVRVAQVRLSGLGDSADALRPAALEAMLAARFFQRYDSTRLNSLGRALVVNAHELHFQFLFAEMRADPACTLPRDENMLRVFNLEGIPQEGFRYDVTYRSRASAIIRATKENHGLTDGFLSFVGREGAILLDAEL